jgi:general secretion pathway protein H
MISVSVAVVSRQLARSGFTLVELLIAITIVGLVMTASVPASVRFYESMQYRQAIRDVITTLASARYRAINTGKAQDVLLNTETKELRLGSDTQQLPAKFNIVVRSARELNRDTEGVIRFYPEGGSSGGEIDITKPNRSGVKISVDWLVGRVSQEKYEFN